MKDFVANEFDSIIKKYGEYTYKTWENEFGVEFTSYGRTYKRLSKEGNNLMTKTNNFKSICARLKMLPWKLVFRW